MSAGDQDQESGGDQIDADHPRPDRLTPYRTGQGHGADTDSAVAGVTGDDIVADDDERDVGPNGRADEPEADVARYSDSPGAGLLRDDEVVPEPNEPG